MTATTSAKAAPGAAPVLNKYRWSAYDASNKVVSGVDNAYSVESLRSELFARKLQPVDISSANSGMQREINFSFRKRAKPKAVATFFVQVATALRGGMSLPRALEAGIESEDPILAAASVEIHKQVSGGGDLAAAMAKHPLVFSKMTIGMVRAGFTSGFLETVLDHISKLLIKEVRLAGSIKSALAYPFVVIGVAIIATIFMMWKIVPMMASMYESIGGAQLPLPTLIVLSISNSMKFWLPLFILVTFLTSVWYGRHRDEDRVRMVVDRLKLKVPGFGTLFHKIALARFCRNLSLLVSSEVPIIGALKLTSETVGNYQMEQAVLRSADALRQGKSIAGVLATEPLFTRDVVRLVDTGEQSANLDFTLSVLADYYEAEVDEITDSIKSIIEPLLIAVVGTLIGALVVAMYLPYFGIGELITQSEAA